MDTTAFTTAMQNTVGSQLPQILGALAIFAIGWIIAIIARAGVRRLLGMSKLNQRINTSTGRQVDAESPIAIAVFWLILMAAVVAALSALNLSTVSAPLDSATMSRYWPPRTSVRMCAHTSLTRRRASAVRSAFATMSSAQDRAR